MLEEIFGFCLDGNEQGVSRCIVSNRDVVHARDDLVSFIWRVNHADPPLISHLYCIQIKETPLHWATRGGHTAIAKLLLQAGADKDAKAEVFLY